MTNSYSIISNCCEQKLEELGVDYVEHLQNAKTMDDVFKNFVYHSQNRSRGFAFNFFKAEESGDNQKRKEAEAIWEIIKKHSFNPKNKYDYLVLFDEFKADSKIKKLFANSSNGKDIQYIQLAKTCQCIRNFLNKYHYSFNEFIKRFKFSSNNAQANIKKINKAADKIYNMGFALICDFFKEQNYIKGHEFLIKPDVHVNRFLTTFFGEEKSNENLYQKLLDLYKQADLKTKKEVPLYKIDKYIYLIGKKLKSPKKAEQFARDVKKRVESQK